MIEKREFEIDKREWDDFLEFLEAIFRIFKKRQFS